MTAAALAEATAATTRNSHSASSGDGFRDSGEYLNTSQHHLPRNDSQGSPISTHDGLILKSSGAIIRPSSSTPHHHHQRAVHKQQQQQQQQQQNRSNINWLDMVNDKSAEFVNETPQRQQRSVNRDRSAENLLAASSVTATNSPSTHHHQHLTSLLAITNAKRKNFYASGQKKLSMSPSASPATAIRLAAHHHSHSGGGGNNVNEKVNYQQQPTTKSDQNEFCNSTAYLQRSVLSYEFLVELERVILRQFSPLVENIVNTMDYNEKQKLEKKRMEEIADEWADVARICDQILCYFFMVFTLGSCFFIFLVSPHFWSEW
jgi:hypothetical protein